MAVMGGRNGAKAAMRPRTVPICGKGGFEFLLASAKFARPALFKMRARVASRGAGDLGNPGYSGPRRNALGYITAWLGVALGAWVASGVLGALRPGAPRGPPPPGFFC